MRPSRRIALWTAAGVAVVVLVVAIFALVANLLIIRDARPFVVGSTSEVPPAPVAIVPAANIDPDGTLPPEAAGRMQAAIDLYEAGKVKAIILSGFPSQMRPMQTYAEQRGVPASDLLLDPAGFDTYDTMSNARSIFHVEKAVICSQRFHLYRSVYLARHVGIDATGLAARTQPYPNAWYGRTVREWLARVKAFLQVHL